MDALSAELESIEGELNGVRRRHDGVRDMVGSLRRRLDGIAERRLARETYAISRRREEARERMERDEEEEQRRRQVLRVEEEHPTGTGGATRTKGGPLTNVSMVEARAVATYVGKSNSDTDT